MLDLAIIGDSIAVGTGAAVGKVPNSIVDAKVGINAKAILDRVHDAARVVISAGSNDPHNPRLVDYLLEIRAAITGRVLWIVPVDKVAALTVRAVASSYGDETEAFTPGPDNVHPRSYAPLADRVKAFRA